MDEPRQHRTGRDEVRRRVMAAAARLFAERGVRGASLDQIALVAGFTKGAVYSNFASKNDLLVQLARQLAIRQVESLVIDIAPSTPFPDMLAVLRDRLGPITPERRQMFALISELRREGELNPEVMSAFVEGRAAVHEAVRSLMEAYLGQHPELQSILPARTLATLAVAVTMGMAFDAPYLHQAGAGDVLAEVFGVLAAAGRRA